MKSLVSKLLVGFAGLAIASAPLAAGAQDWHGDHGRGSVQRNDNRGHNDNRGYVQRRRNDRYRVSYSQPVYQNYSNGYYGYAPGGFQGYYWNGGVVPSSPLERRSVALLLRLPTWIRIAAAGTLVVLARLTCARRSLSWNGTPMPATIDCAGVVTGAPARRARSLDRGPLRDVAVYDRALLRRPRNLGLDGARAGNQRCDRRGRTPDTGRSRAVCARRNSRFASRTVPALGTALTVIGHPVSAIRGPNQGRWTVTYARMGEISRDEESGAVQYDIYCTRLRPGRLRQRRVRSQRSFHRNRLTASPRSRTSRADAFPMGSMPRSSRSALCASGVVLRCPDVCQFAAPPQLPAVFLRASSFRNRHVAAKRGPSGADPQTSRTRRRPVPALFSFFLYLPYAAARSVRGGAGRRLGPSARDGS